MNTLSSLKFSAVLLPVLAFGMPMALAGDPGSQSADQRAVASATSKTHETAHHGYLGAKPDRGYHSDSLVGKDVMNRRNNESIGKVSNLVMDEDGQVVAVIISVGGLLGMGQRDVAIEWDQIQRRVDGDDIALSVDLAEGSLDDAPEYHGDRPDRSTAMTGSERDNQPPGQRADPRSGQSTDQTRATARMAEYVETMPALGFQSDSLVGKTVKSRHNNESVGEVNNLVFDSNGQIVAAVISVGGLMGIGARDVAIAWDQIERRVEGDETTLWVNLTEQNLKDAPKFSTDRTTSRRAR